MDLIIECTAERSEQTLARGGRQRVEARSRRNCTFCLAAWNHELGEKPAPYELAVRGGIGRLAEQVYGKRTDGVGSDARGNRKSRQRQSAPTQGKYETRDQHLGGSSLAESLMRAKHLTEVR
jgi:hypothetical protein